jgi:hypothetical protein
MTDLSTSELIVYFIEDLLKLDISDESCLHLIRAFIKIVQEVSKEGKT